MNEKKLEAFVIDKRKRGVDNRDIMDEKLVVFSDTTFCSSMVSKTYISEYDRYVLNEIYEDITGLIGRIPNYTDLIYGIEEYNDEIIQECVAIETANLYGDTLSQDELLSLIDNLVEDEINTRYQLNEANFDDLITRIYKYKHEKIKTKGEFKVEFSRIYNFLEKFFYDEKLNSENENEISEISDRMVFDEVDLYVGSSDSIVNKHLLTFGMAKIGSRTVLFPEEVKFNGYNDL